MLRLGPRDRDGNGGSLSTYASNVVTGFWQFPEWRKGGWPDVQNLVNRKSERLILTSQGSLNFSVFFTFPKLVTSLESCLDKEDIWRRMCLGGYSLRTPRKHLTRHLAKVFLAITFVQISASAKVNQCDDAVVWGCDAVWCNRGGPKTCHQVSSTLFVKFCALKGASRKVLHLWAESSYTYNHIIETMQGSLK